MQRRVRLISTGTASLILAFSVTLLITGCTSSSSKNPSNLEPVKRMEPERSGFDGMKRRIDTALSYDALAPLVKDALKALRTTSNERELQSRNRDLLNPLTGINYVYLAGEFKIPGPMVIPTNSQPTVVKTILRSGGITEAADLSQVTILRIPEKESFTGLHIQQFNAISILEGRGVGTDLAIEIDDIVIIPRKPF